MKSIEPKLYPGIDYEFRPESFWDAPLDPLAAILRNVKGRNRRQMIRDYYAAGKLDQLSDELLRDSLSDEARISLGKIHPTFMGGEYLPDYGRQEVEIARIALASTTSDVISLRARPSGSRIKYRVVDEYATEFQLPQQTSRRPFSLRQLIRFSILWSTRKTDASWKGFGFVLSYNEGNLDCGTDLETLQDFTSVSSDFYPELGSHYREAIEDWYLSPGAIREDEPQGILRGRRDSPKLVSGSIPRVVS
jgi:hypothetical protein